MIAAYRHADPAAGRELIARLITSASTGVPDGLEEFAKLDCTLEQRANDVLAYFDPPGTSNGPNRGHRWSVRTIPRIRPRVPELDQLHRQSLLESGRFRPE